jgi:hypothetical protein
MRRAFPTHNPTQHNTNKQHRLNRTASFDLEPPLHKRRDYIVAMSNVPRSHTPAGSRLSTVPSQKPRQLSHLQAQLAQLTANMADLESLMRMTAGQAQDMRGLGGYAGAM